MICYHRRSLDETDGNHRVTCLEKLEFRADGSVAPVKLSFEGIAAHPARKGAKLCAIMPDLLSPDYAPFLADLQTRIAAAQVKASLSVNREMIALYFDVGRLLVEKQENAGWGDAVVAQIARDLKRELPDIKGFSRSKLFEMRQFYLAHREESPIVPQAVGQIPWGHNLVLLHKIKSSQPRFWYAAQTIEHGWSRAVLTYQIESDPYARQTSELKSHPFARTLPAPDSDGAAQLLKDSTVFDFLPLGPDAKDRDL